MSNKIYHNLTISRHKNDHVHLHCHITPAAPKLWKTVILDLTLTFFANNEECTKLAW